MERLEFESVDEEGNEVVLELPAVYAVCPRCEGKGSIVNPNIGVVTGEQFEEDPDFREAYFAGVYDITCPRCAGQRVVLVPIVAGADPQVLKAYRRHLRAIGELEQMERMEQRMQLPPEEWP
jgi:hypothetical protein